MTTLSPCPEIDQLRAFVLGGLAESDGQAITQHLRLCSECRTRFQGLKESELTTRCFAPTSQAGQSRTQDPYPFLQPPLEPDEIGRLGEYRVLRLLGRGGMGMVFQAEDTTLRRPVALKVITTSPTEENTTGKRFLREARLLASIKHKHVVSVFKTGQVGDVMYLAMELLSGESLEDWMNRVKRPSPVQILRLAREIASGLAVVHSHGLIHRDIKPANIWLENPSVADAPELSRAGSKATRAGVPGRVKLLDFGLARHVQGDSQLTQTGSILGTPAFMSPEQARGDQVDERSDLFSLGCVLYCLAAGKSPFRSETPMAVLTSLAVDTPSPVQKHRPDLPEPLAGLIMHLLEKDPANRPDSADEVLEQCRQIKAWLADPSSPRPAGRGRSWPAWLRQRSVWIGLTVALSFLVGLAILLPLLRRTGNPAAPSNPRTVAGGPGDRGPAGGPPFVGGPTGGPLSSCRFRLRERPST